MVTFSDLRLAENRKSLYIDCFVEDLDIYEGIYIKSIYLEYYKNSVSFGVPSNKAILVYENTEDDTDVRTVRKCVRSSDLNAETFGVDTFEGGIFYVIVTCDGTVPAQVSHFACGTDDTVDIGIVLDWKMLYEAGMQFVAAMTSRCGSLCDGNKDFMEFVMMWHAIRLALASCDYKQLGVLWEKYKRMYNGESLGLSSGCGCNR